MNAGEYLLSKSPLNSGTALAHLLAMQTGGVRTIFASQMTVCVEEPQVTVVQRPKRETRTNYQPQVSSSSEDARQAIFVVTRTARMNVTTACDELFVQTERVRAIVTRDLGEKRITVRQSGVVSIN